MKTLDVVCLGEAMIRLSPPHFQRLEQTRSLEVQVGGAELNVAVGLARLGKNSAWVSKLPENPLGRLIANKAREQGVDTSHILWTGGSRAGLYFVEFGATPRPSSVLYDRANSAVSTLKPGEINWKSVLPGAQLFFVSGITPALSRTCAEATLEALQAAQASGCKTCVDVNYRARLWSEEEANRCMSQLMEYTDLLITTEEDTARVFRIKEDDYREVARRLQERFGFEVVAITLREDLSVWRNNWTALLYAGGKIYEDVTYPVEIVDRLGAGDSFTAGFLYGYLEGDLEKGLKYGNAFAALKHSIPGDLNWTTREEVERLIQGAGLRIQR